MRACLRFLWVFSMALWKGYHGWGLITCFYFYFYLWLYIYNAALWAYTTLMNLSLTFCDVMVMMLAILATLA